MDLTGGARSSAPSGAASGFDTSCDLTPQVLLAVRRAGGDGNSVYGRAVLVRHDGGALELLTLFVQGDQVIDSTGTSYAGLDEFRAKNRLLKADDVIRVPRDLTAVPGEGEIVTVFGHTRSTYWIWVAAAGGVLVLVLILVAVVRRRSIWPS